MVCHKRPDGCNLSLPASHSRGKLRLEGTATLVLLPHSLVKRHLTSACHRHLEVGRAPAKQAHMRFRSRRVPCSGSSMPAQAQLPCLLMAQLHPTAVHPQGWPSIPRPDSTFSAAAHEPLGRLTRNLDSTTTRDPGERARSTLCSRRAIFHKRTLPSFTSRTYLVHPVATHSFHALGTFI